jgi:hypothetical protein
MVIAVTSAAPTFAQWIGAIVVLLVTVGLLVGVPIWVLYLIWRSIRRRARAKQDARVGEQAAAAAQLSEQDQFLREYAAWTDYWHSYFDQSFIAVDVPGRRIALGVIGRATSYPFDAITAVEPVKDGASVTTRRDQPMTPYLFDGVQYFEERALLKAIESPTTSINTVRELALKVTVDDAQSPLYTINFFHALAASGVDSASRDVVDSANAADKFHAYIANALRDRATARLSANTPIDTAGQLKSLWDLKQAGALTEDEFDRQKAKLLERG